MTVIEFNPNQLTPKARLAALTVEQYHEMIRAGIFPSGSPVELLDGLLVLKDRSKEGADPMSVGEEHAYINDILVAMSGRLPRGCYIRSQQPISVLPDSEPEPDACIVRGSPRDYRDRHPGPTDVLTLIEVSDSSLRHDRTTKLKIYAKAGIGHYVIINLVDRVIEDHQRPLPAEGRYEQKTVLHPDQTLALSLTEGARLDVAVAELLPSFEERP